MVDQRETAGRAVHCMIHTPLAYLCLREYLALYPYAERFLYVLATSHAAYEGVRALQQHDSWTGLYPISTGRRPTKADRLIAPFRLALAHYRLGRMLRKIGKRDDIVLSHINNPFSRFVVERTRGRDGATIMVDDGTTTLAEFGTLARSGAITLDEYGARGNNLNARLERVLFSDATVRSGDVQYFSFWPLDELVSDLSPPILAKNEFSQMRANLPSGASLPCAYVVGQPFVRRGLVDAQEYGDTLSRIGRHYAERGLGMVYFPHRNETVAQLPESIEVRRIEQPFELYLRDAERLPQVVAGFYSNCLITTKYLFADRIDHELFWGFSGLTPDKASSPDITRMLERESTRLPAFEIDRTLNRPVGSPPRPVTSAD